MKPELNQKLKERFFAQYIGQKVAAYDVEGGSPEVLKCDPLDQARHDFMYLQLRPVSSIFDDEAIEVAKIVNGDDGWETPQDGRKAIAELDFLWPSPSAISHLNDYLRSKSFALPYHGHSVAELEKSGWIKLVEG